MVEQLSNEAQARLDLYNELFASFEHACNDCAEICRRENISTLEMPTWEKIRSALTEGVLKTILDMFDPKIIIFTPSEENSRWQVMVMEGLGNADTLDDICSFINLDICKDVPKAVEQIQGKTGESVYRINAQTLMVDELFADYVQARAQAEDNCTKKGISIDGMPEWENIKSRLTSEDLSKIGKARGIKFIIIPPGEYGNPCTDKWEVIITCILQYPKPGKDRSTFMELIKLYLP